MKKKVANVVIAGRTHSVTYDKKVKNLTVEYTVHVRDSLLKQKGISHYRFQVYSKNMLLPDATKSAEEKDIKLTIAKAILENAS